MKYFFELVFLILLSVLKNEVRAGCFNKTKANVCGYERCPTVKPGMLNVHLIPHSHDDVGWLKTVDQYYVGSKTYIQNAGVVYILDSVIQALEKDPNRRFVYVEIAFFWRWWQEQTLLTRLRVKKLVRTGRLEISGGAWSMSDEAVTHYQSVIDQFTWGFRKINESVGECGYPRTAWQIDTFGHSRETASMLAEMGFDGLFFSRLDYEDYKYRLNKKTAEMIWEASPNLGASSNLFTSIVYDHYYPPASFCFDILCQPSPIIDDERDPDYNADKWVNKFIKYSETQAKKYASNNILITMGGDFHYQSAATWFVNLDKLIRNVNLRQLNGSHINVLYSTPFCYLKAVNDANLTWPTKQDDFFPYASSEEVYWTGYYTSRPTLKYFERMGNNFLQVGKQLESMTQLGQVGMSQLDNLRETMGVMQHHDAITGTEQQHVADDYSRLLYIGIEDSGKAIQVAIQKIMMKSDAGVNLTSCLLLNVSQCEITEKSEPLVVTVYNPIGRRATHYVRFPIDVSVDSVIDPYGKEVLSQIVPIPDPVLNIPGRESRAKHELVFEAVDLPPLGFRSYYVYWKDPNIKTVKIKPSNDTFISNKNVRVEMDPNGLVGKVITNNEEILLRQSFYYYISGTTSAGKHSGAYIFKPQGKKPVEVPSRSNISVHKGVLVDEVEQTFSPWVSQVIRLYRREKHVEFEWTIGPIPIGDHKGKEVVSKFTTLLQSKNFFFTDSNGRDMITRRRNYQPTWPASITEPVAANYYPVTSRIVVRDEVKGLEMAVLTDRAQGASSMTSGEVELMVHRRLLYDDVFGVSEPLNEKAFDEGLMVRGKHYLVLGSINGSDKGPSLAAEERDLAHRKLLSPLVFFSEVSNLDLQEWKKKYNMEFSGMKEDLPPNVHLLTLEPWNNGTLLLRLEHILEKNDDPYLSRPVTVNLTDMFTTFSIESFVETTLGGNIKLEDSKRLVWNSARERENTANKSNKSKRSRRMSASNVDNNPYVQDNHSTATMNNNQPPDTIYYDKQPITMKNNQSIHSKIIDEQNNEIDCDELTDDNDMQIFWKSKCLSGKIKKVKSIDEMKEFVITLKPMEIRTFLIKVKPLKFKIRN